VECGVDFCECLQSLVVKELGALLIIKELDDHVGSVIEGVVHAA
jgi:hypothetical protein